MMKKKRKQMRLAGLAVILLGLTTTLFFFIRDQPDPGHNHETSTQQKGGTHENTTQINSQSTKEDSGKDSIKVYGINHLYYLDPGGDQIFQKRLTHFVKDHGLDANSAEVLEYCIDNRDKETEPAQFFLTLDDDFTIVKVSFEKKTGIYRFKLYDGPLNDVNVRLPEAEEKMIEIEIPESKDTITVPVIRLSIIDPEGELEAVAKMKELEKHLWEFLRSEGEGRRNFYVSSVIVTEDGYQTLLCFETVRQDGRNVEVTYDGDYHFSFV